MHGQISNGHLCRRECVFLHLYTWEKPATTEESCAVAEMRQDQLITTCITVLWAVQGRATSSAPMPSLDPPFFIQEGVGPRLLYSQPLKWLHVVDQTMDSNMAFIGINHRSKTSTQPLAVPGPLTHSRPSAAAPVVSFEMASGGYTWYSTWFPEAINPVGLYQGIRQWYRLPMSTKISVFIVAWGIAWITEISMAAGGITGHGCPLRRSNPKNESFLISSLHRCPGIPL